MIANSFEYSKPASLAEALTLLADGSAKPLAGGMSLIPMMKLRLASPEKLVDLSGVPGLAAISESGGVIKVGAMATHYALETSPVLRGKCPLLSETAANIGDVQVRNSGTIGGAAAHADPSADYPAALLALEAKFVVASKSGTRTVNVQDLFVDALSTSLEPGELIQEIQLPVDDSGTGTCYKKVFQPASGYATVGIAVRVRKTAGKISFARIGVTGLASKAFRATAVEEALVAGKSAADAAALVNNGVDANSDIHASADYRKHLAQVTTARAITAALARIA
jgi:carbon-monoxide dehydrogenase medium subunit